MSSFKTFLLSFLYSLLCFIIIIGIILGINLLNKEETAQSNITNVNNQIKILEDHKLNILIIGVKNRSGPLETLSILKFNPEENMFITTSLPTDIESTVNIKTDTLGNLYEYGGNGMLAEAVSNLLNIPINRYIRIDMQGTEKIIDFLGGIKLELEEDLEYIDINNNLTTILPSGKISVDSDTLYSIYNSYYSIDNPAENIEMQNYIIKIILENIKNFNKNLNLDQFYNIIVNETDTNITLYDFTYRKEILQSMINNNLEAETISINFEKESDKLTIPASELNLIQNLFK